MKNRVKSNECTKRDEIKYQMLGRICRRNDVDHATCIAFFLVVQRKHKPKCTIHKHMIVLDRLEHLVVKSSLWTVCYSVPWLLTKETPTSEVITLSMMPFSTSVTHLKGTHAALTRNTLLN